MSEKTSSGRGAGRRQLLDVGVAGLATLSLATAGERVAAEPSTRAAEKAPVESKASSNAPPPVFVASDVIRPVPAPAQSGGDASFTLAKLQRLQKPGLEEVLKEPLVSITDSCVCHAVCGCVPVQGCACNSVCTCDTVKSCASYTTGGCTHICTCIPAYAPC